jgi:hypothetical protein
MLLFSIIWVTSEKSHSKKEGWQDINLEWIKKIWYLYTVEFYSATKKNEILSFASEWMELENIILSDVSQAQKAKIARSPS